MSAPTLVLKSVRDRLRQRGLVDLKEKEIEVLPEGRVPASAGQLFLSLSPTGLRRINVGDFSKKYRLNFRINLICRIRDIPNDEFGEVYLDKLNYTGILEQVQTYVESLDMLQYLIEQATTELVPNYLETDSTRQRWSVSGQFIHYSTILEPIHLYPGFFLTKSAKNDSKIAGYKFYSSFASPILTDLYNTSSCSP